MIDRDLYVASAPGTWRVMDLNFLPTRLIIGNDVTVTFANLDMRNARWVRAAAEGGGLSSGLLPLLVVVVARLL